MIKGRVDKTVKKKHYGAKNKYTTKDQMATNLFCLGQG